MIKKYKSSFFVPPSEINIWVILGLFLVSLIFWNRFLRLRLPRDLMEFSWQGVLILWIIFTLLFFWNLKKIFFTQTQLSENFTNQLRAGLNLPGVSWCAWVWVRTFLAPQEFLRYILGKVLTISRIVPWLKGLVEFWKPWTDVPSMRKLTLFFILGPSLIPPLVLYGEIVFSQKLHYFYYSLFILALPLLSRAYLATLSYTMDYGRWLLQEQGIYPGELLPGEEGQLKLTFPVFWCEEKQDFLGQTYVSLWELGNWEANIQLIREDYGPYFSLAVTGIYAWNWLLILAYLNNLW